MNSQIENELKDWIYEVSRKNPKLADFSICPFAKNNSYKIVQQSIHDIRPLDEEFGVVIFVVEDDVDPDFVRQKCKELSETYSKYTFFDDCRDEPSFINGVQTNNGKYNLILYQDKAFLRKMREILAKTTYYDQWDLEYLKIILGEDFDIIENKYQQG
jgi:predicted MPP superfamily phosphohydrolase